MHLECIWSELGILVLGLGAPGVYLECTWLNLECTWVNLECTWIGCIWSALGLGVLAILVLESGVLGVYLGEPDGVYLAEM